LPAAYRSLTFASPDLTSVKLSGKAKTVTIDGQNDLSSVTIGGHVTTLVVQNNESLETVTLTGATIGNVTLNNNDNMSEAVLNHTSYTTTTDLGVTISVDGNKDLATLRIHADKVDNLSIEDNPSLTTVDFGTATTGLNTVGNTAAKSVTVSIKNNKLTASSAKDSWQASTATVDAGSYTTSSGLDGLQTYLDAAIPLASASSTGGVKVFFDVITEYTLQSTENGTFTAQTVPTVSYSASNIYAVAYYEAAATTGRTTKQSTTAVIPVAFDANDADVLLSTSAAEDVITIVNGIGGTKSFEAISTNSIRTVDDLVAAIDGDTTVAGLTVTADRDAFNEQVVTVSWVTSNGAAGLASATGVVYFTYGKDPETGATISGVTGNITSGQGSGAIAVAIATALNGSTDAYVATGTTDGKILITALISNTILEDRSPLSHGFNTLSIPALVATTTLKWAGNDSAHVIAASSSSNTTANASKLFTVGTSAKLRSGVRVTLQNTAGTTDLSSMAATVGTTSTALRYGDGTVVFGKTLTTSDIVAASINSSALDYVATFAQIEAVVPGTSTSGTTDRTGWLK